ncbi:CvpA family protein [Herbaspirillum sp. RTI4]|uniref:CvpA family protein n=1 Tax=Herbaspirillum sp. RTI4 TaxID=3048640 RepID=UPI002AB528F8|nr:CvpA family protein [Herbaspirillum sp. RTI4]MDY7578043.1 CvpA family protein [Herbaspirillum sp. RTI4]MEA9983173.1 CvpA family protein [Herbaspirillum sp. RTI4]
MTIFDYLVLGILLCSFVISTLRGLTKEMLSLASWVAALAVANLYCEPLATMLPDLIPGNSTRLIVAFIALFIGVRLLMALLTRALSEVIKAGGLSVADRGLGGLFGLARGAVIVVIAVLLCGTTSIPQQPFWTNAMLSPAFVMAAERVKPYLPGQFGQHIHF